MQFYSPEWIAAFNDAVAGLDAADVDTGASLKADTGSFRVLQVVRRAGGEADVPVMLVVDGGAIRLEPGSGPPEPDVIVSIGWDDAVALSRGELDSAAALGTGRIRVRGDLAVLVAAQAVLVAAAGRLDALREATTY